MRKQNPGQPPARTQDAGGLLHVLGPQNRIDGTEERLLQQEVNREVKVKKVAHQQVIFRKIWCHLSQVRKSRRRPVTNINLGKPLLVQMDGLVGPSGTGDQDAQLLVIQLVGITE